jgi:crossover junction endodeoxyribonuclease RusA
MNQVLTSQTMVLMIPPSQLITSNHRLHWRAKAVKTADLKAIAAWSAKAQLQPVTRRQRITVTFGFITPHRRDVGNWSDTTKALVDGLVLAGILKDDSTAYVEGPDHRLGVLSTDCHTQPVRALRRVRVTIRLEDA